MVSMARTLKHRNYRLFFAGQTISLIGTWLNRVAISWLVYKLSGSAYILGLVSFSGQILTFLLAPAAGVYIDRWDRHRVLIITQILAMIQSGFLTYFTFQNHLTINILIALSALQGLITAFDTPCRQSFLFDMVQDRRDLPNAIALNSTIVNIARLLGPSMAGLLIAWVGEGGCFLIDTVSYLAVIGSLLFIHINKKIPHPSSVKKHVWLDFWEGWIYVINSHPIRSIIGLLALVSLVGMPYLVLLPLMVTQKLNGGPYALGYLTAASGLGALTGALYLASRKSILGLGRIITKSVTIMGIGLVGFSLSQSYGLSLIFLYLVGLGMMVQMAATNTILQTIVDEDKRGRVMSFYTMAFMGMIPFGSLLSGVMAEYIGVSFTILIGGIICLLGALWFYNSYPRFREHLRILYIKLDILTE